MEDKKAQFERLYDLHADAIFRYFAWRVSDRERAKELTNEVFMRLWRHLAGGGEIEYEKTFLYTIAKRLFINEIRTPDTTFSLDALSEDTAFEVKDEDVSILAAAEGTELWSVIATLPPPTPELLQLRYRDGLSVKEIATIFESKETAISMRIARAITHLRSLYEPPIS